MSVGIFRRVSTFRAALFKCLLIPDSRMRRVMRTDSGLFACANPDSRLFACVLAMHTRLGRFQGAAASSASSRVVVLVCGETSGRAIGVPTNDIATRFVPNGSPTLHIAIPVPRAPEHRIKRKGCHQPQHQRRDLTLPGRPLQPA